MAAGDDVAAGVAAAEVAAHARYSAHEADALPAGGTIGVLVDLPPVVSDWSKHTGGSDAHGEATCALSRGPLAEDG